MNLEESLLPENMILLYAQGAFPMADKLGKLDWYYPEIRTIIPLDSYNVPRSLKKFIRESSFDYMFDNHVLDVVKECSNRSETWISDEIIEGYKGLFENGFLHSVEVYEKNKLVGGLYGVSFRGAFFGESMFSKVPQASKCALVKLIEHLNLKGYKLLDVQYITAHLKMFGAKEISLKDYNYLLSLAHKTNAYFL